MTQFECPALVSTKRRTAPDRRDDLHRLRRLLSRLPGGAIRAGAGRGERPMSADVGTAGRVPRQQISWSAASGGRGCCSSPASSPRRPSRRFARTHVGNARHGPARRDGPLPSEGGRIRQPAGPDRPGRPAPRPQGGEPGPSSGVPGRRRRPDRQPPVPTEAGPGIRVHAVDADALARSAGDPHAVNLVLLGFALARIGGATAGGIFCSAGEIRKALSRRHGGGGSRLADALSALDLGFARGT